MIFKGEEKIQLISDFSQIAKSIREHNRIHQEKEPNSIFISEYLEKAADLFDKIANGDIRIVRHGYWIDNSNKTWSCSICQSWIPDEQHSYARYCLHCGAEMDLKEDKDGKE